MRLENKNILVVGVGPGLGSATTYFLLNEKANVSIAARNPDKLAGIGKELEKYGKVAQIAGDASSISGAEKIIKDAAAETGNGKLDGIAILVGSYIDTPIESLNEQALESMVSVNLKAPLYVVKAALPHLSPGSSLVMVSSVLGTHSVGVKSVAYSSTKAAVAKAVEVLSAELLDKQIRVNGVAPRSMNNDFAPERDWKAQRKLGDLACPPEDVARVVVWLMTDEANWVNGVVIPVDGGFRRK